MTLLIKVLKSLALFFFAFIGIIYIVNLSEGREGIASILVSLQNIKDWQFGYTAHGTKIEEELTIYFIRSLKLIIPAFIISMVVGVAKGMIMFYFRKKELRNIWLIDRIIFGSLPDFFMFISFQLILWTIMDSLMGVGIPRLDLMGHEFWYNAIFPTLILCIYPIVFISHMTYKSLSEDENKDYIRTAYSKGTSEYFVITRHLLRNSWGTILSYTQTVMLYIVTSLPVIEFVALYEGAGYYLFRTIREDDLSIIIPLSVYFLAIMLISLLISETIKYLLVPSTIELEQDPSYKTVSKKRRLVWVIKFFDFSQRYPLLSLGTSMLSLLVVVAVFGPILPFVDNELERFTFKFLDSGQKILAPPLSPGEEGYLFGSDRDGRDLFSMLVLGAKTTLLQVFIIALLRYLIAIPLGYFASINSSIRGLSSWLNGVLSFFPSIIIVAVLSKSPAIAMSEQRMYWMLFLIAIIEVGRVSEIMKSEFLKIRQNEYIDAGIVAGNTSFQLLKRYYLPNMYQKLIYNFVNDMSRVMFVLGLLGFVSIYVDQTWVSTPSGGYYQNDSLSWPFFLENYLQDIRSAMWIPLFSSIVIAYTILSLNIFGEGLQQYFERKWRKDVKSMTKKEKSRKRIIIERVVKLPQLHPKKSLGICVLITAILIGNLSSYQLFPSTEPTSTQVDTDTIVDVTAGEGCVEEIQAMRHKYKDFTLIGKYKDLKMIDVHTHDSTRYQHTKSSWDMHHIDQLMISGYVSRKNGVLSDEMAWEAYRKYPDRLYPFFSSFDIYDEAGIETIRTNLELGFMGIGEVAAHSTQSPIVSKAEWKGKHALDGNLPKMYEMAAEYNVPVLLHIDPPRGEAITTFEEAMTSYPNTNFIFGHANAFSQPADLEKLLEKHSNLYIDFFAGFTAYNPQSSLKLADFVELIEKHPDKVLISSDSGFDVSYKKAYLAMYELIDLLTPETACKVAHENFLNLMDNQVPTTTQLQIINDYSGKLGKMIETPTTKTEANKLMFVLEKELEINQSYLEIGELTEEFIGQSNKKKMDELSEQEMIAISRGLLLKINHGMYKTTGDGEIVSYDQLHNETYFKGAVLDKYIAGRKKRKDLNSYEYHEISFASERVEKQEKQFIYYGEMYEDMTDIKSKKRAQYYAGYKLVIKYDEQSKSYKIADEYVVNIEK
ncbi:ABC transporter permease subunit [Cytobacillus suaedae]|nr:ABC transporter permease subunit [Cytobacillus suaedae]